MNRPPNILFAFADDWGRYAGAYRGRPGASPLNDLISTPTIDRVAGEGVLFTNALVPAPTCTPCRSSVLSGRYFWQTRLGAILQGAVWDDAIPSYPRILAQAGYHTGATWKVWGPGVYATHITPYGTDEHYYNGAGFDFNNFSHKAMARVRQGMHVEAAKQPLYDEVLHNFRSFLGARRAGQPFCYWWGPTNTHRTWEKGSGKDLWGIDPDTLQGRLPDFLPDVHDIREDVADYLGECQAVDRGLAVLLAELEAIGELDNTLIVVSGDHGIPGFPRAKCNLYDLGSEVAFMARLPGAIPAGSVVEDMTNLMDLAPTFLEAAGVPPDPGMAGRSLWPRMTGQAGPSARDWVVTGRERHVATAREWNLPYPQRAIRTRDFLYIHNFAPNRWPMGDPTGMDDPDASAIAWRALENNTFAAYADMDASPTKAWMVHHRADPEHAANFQLGFGKRPREELYDLRVDPHHMRNLADHPPHAPELRRLRELLMAELRTQRDPRVCEADCRYERGPYTDVVRNEHLMNRQEAAERLTRAGS